MFYGASGEMFAMARILRQNTTEPEKLLWEKIAGSQLSRFRFKRQHPIAHYIVDFYCHKARLVVELDGDYHNKADQKIYDMLRTEDLVDFGLTVLRFSNEQVKNRIDDVLKVISDHLRKAP